MKCISLWQPWATLWLLSDPDEKVFETRHWYTSYRGPLLVHAAKKRDGEILSAVYDPDVIAAFVRHGINTIEDLGFGAIIGQVKLVGCARMDRMPPPSKREASFGDWQPDRYAWERGPAPRRFAYPIPYRGSQGFFDVPDSILGQEAATFA
jgi:hypothetical protein